MDSQRKKLLASGVASRNLRSNGSSFVGLLLLIGCTATMLLGCTAIPLNRIQPTALPPKPNPPCKPPKEYRYLPNESKDDDFHYVPPIGSSVAKITDFETYQAEVKKTAQDRLPPSLQNHKVTKAFIEMMAYVIGEAQLNAQIADGTLKNPTTIAAERKAISKHKPPSKLTHGEMKDFADKLFDLALKPSAADLTNSVPDESSLSAKEAEFLKDHPALDKVLVAYFKAYYAGQFTDRMGTTLTAPQIASTIPDSEIVAAETVLLEFLIDLIDQTPVMGDTKTVTTNTHFYPGNFTKVPTANSSGLANYVGIQPGSANACGITTQNAWVLKDLANGSSDAASGVGGLVANTPGGVSLGLGVIGKISIGDNQTLSVMVKTAASRIALRATLASSYYILRNVKFNVTEPGS